MSRNYRFLNWTGGKKDKTSTVSEAKSDEPTVAQQSNLLMNCTINDDKMAKLNSEDFTQIIIEEPTTSKDIDNFIDENGITEICNSIEVQKWNNSEQNLDVSIKSLKLKKSSTDKFIAKITNIKLYMTKTKNAKCRWETKKYGKTKKYTSQNEETQL